MRKNKYIWIDDRISEKFVFKQVEKLFNKNFDILGTKGHFILCSNNKDRFNICKHYKDKYPDFNSWWG